MFSLKKKRVLDAARPYPQVHDGPLAGQEVPHVHFHVFPRTEGDGGVCAGIAAFPKAPPMGSVDPDFAALAALSEKLQAVE